MNARSPPNNIDALFEAMRVDGSVNCFCYVSKVVTRISIGKRNTLQMLYRLVVQYHDGEAEKEFVRAGLK